MARAELPLVVTRKDANGNLVPVQGATVTVTDFDTGAAVSVWDGPVDGTAITPTSDAEGRVTGWVDLGKRYRCEVVHASIATYIEYFTPGFIDAGAVTTAKLADGAVTTAKLADGAVTTAKRDRGKRIEFSAVTSVDITGFASEDYGENVMQRFRWAGRIDSAGANRQIYLRPAARTSARNTCHRIYQQPDGENSYHDIIRQGTDAGLYVAGSDWNASGTIQVDGILKWTPGQSKLHGQLTYLFAPENVGWGIGFIRYDIAGYVSCGSTDSYWRLITTGGTFSGVVTVDRVLV